jgi:hypothetical protein
MENYMYILIMIPVVFFLSTLSYHMGKLFYLWIKFKLQTIKEINIWD